jgi:hypothetical protein
MRIRLVSILATLAVLFASTLALPLGVSAQPRKPERTTSNSFPVTATGTAPSGPVTFEGTLVAQQFHVTDGVLFVTGILSGTLTESATGTQTAVPEQSVDLPVKEANGKPLPSGGAAAAPAAEDFDMQIAQVGSCSILDLVLGPLHLDLLGLVVDLNQVILSITAVPGNNNLLGNLLCAITGLLDVPGSLAIISNLLNAVLDILELLQG